MQLWKCTLICITEYGDPLSRQVLETLPLEQYHKTIILADQDKDLSSHPTTTTAMFVRHIQVPLLIQILNLTQFHGYSEPSVIFKGPIIGVILQLKWVCPLRVSLGCFACNINNCCPPVVHAQRWCWNLRIHNTTYFGSLRVELNFATSSHAKWVWTLMNWFRVFFVQTSTLPPSLHNVFAEEHVVCKKQPTLVFPYHNCVLQSDPTWQ